MLYNLTLLRLKIFNASYMRPRLQNVQEVPKLNVSIIGLYNTSMRHVSRYHTCMQKLVGLQIHIFLSETVFLRGHL